MNRLFGRGKPKEPGPSLNDCISGVSNTVNPQKSFNSMNISIAGGREGRKYWGEDCEAGDRTA